MSLSRFNDGGLVGGGFLKALSEHLPVALVPSPLRVGSAVDPEEEPGVIAGIGCDDRFERRGQIERRATDAGRWRNADRTRDARMSLAEQLTLFELETGVPKTFCMQMLPTCVGPLSAANVAPPSMVAAARAVTRTPATAERTRPEFLVFIISLVVCCTGEVRCCCRYRLTRMHVACQRANAANAIKALRRGARTACGSVARA